MISTLLYQQKKEEGYNWQISENGSRGQGERDTDVKNKPEMTSPQLERKKHRFVTGIEIPENYLQVHLNAFQNYFQEHLLCCVVLDLQSRSVWNSVVNRVNAQLLQQLQYAVENSLQIPKMNSCAFLCSKILCDTPMESD